MKVETGKLAGQIGWYVFVDGMLNGDIAASSNEDMAEQFVPLFTEEELWHLLLALQPEEDYHGSEWCRTGHGQTIDCDAYTLRYNRNRRDRWPHGLKIYVKFGFREPLLPCIVVSIHPSSY